MSARKQPRDSKGRFRRRYIHAPPQGTMGRLIHDTIKEWGKLKLQQIKEELAKHQALRATLNANKTG